MASHAIALGVVVVTNNEEDFPGYPGLSVENWVKGV
jgi:tRNA(fMet)-specific endonuclease VapC